VPSDALAGRRPSQWWLLGWLVPLAVQLAHSAAVAPMYHVGSFDDDANYLMAAHVLAAGGGLTTRMPSGAVVVANYLPGYPLLLVPLVRIWGGALWPPRVFSAVCIALVYPLAWAWMGRRGVKPQYRAGVLGLLALNSVLATYSTMVMAEAPFLVVLMLALLALERWERRPGLLWATVEVVLLAELVWLKEAGIGLAAGMVLYELWRRRWWRATGVGAGVGVLLLPGIVARLVTGGALVGNRYAGEISNPSEGGIVHQLPGEVVADIWAYLKDVLRQSVLPPGDHLMSAGLVGVLVGVIGVSVPVLVVVGGIAWYRRHPHAESWMVLVYFGETLAYPFANQRRIILVLPVVTLWYAVGAGVVGRFVLARSRHKLSRAGAFAVTLVAVLAAGVPPASGFTKDYLYPVGVQSAEFARSPAMALLKEIGPPSAVVETDYRGAVAYFSGHRTAWTAFTETTPYGPFAAQHVGNCTVANVKGALGADDAKFLIVGDFNIPGVVDSPCLLRVASAPSTAKAIGSVRLLSSEHDDTSVFELLGPGSSQPGLSDLTAGTAPSSPAVRVELAPNGQGDAGATAYSAPATAGEARFVWTWARARPLSQVSIALAASAGSATATRAGSGPAASGGSVTATTVAIELPGGAWHTVASVPGPVGNNGKVPYLLAKLPPGTLSVGVRVIVSASGTAEVGFVNAIGLAH